MSSVSTSKFKTTGGIRLTRGLFYETTGADKSTVIYTLKETDHEGYPSLYRLYMECADPTEYEFAVSYLDGWSHWEMLCEASWFKPVVTAWRRELEIKLRSAALRRISVTATAENSREALTANKFLLDWNKSVTGSSKRARATEVAAAAETHQRALEAEQTTSDAERLNLKGN